MPCSWDCSPVARTISQVIHTGTYNAQNTIDLKQLSRVQCFSTATLLFPDALCMFPVNAQPLVRQGFHVIAWLQESLEAFTLTGRRRYGFSFWSRTSDKMPSYHLMKSDNRLFLDELNCSHHAGLGCSLPSAPGPDFPHKDSALGTWSLAKGRAL